MNITNIDISRVIAHEVVRASQLTERPPILSDNLVTLDDKGKALVGKRLVDTVASGSHCVEVTVADESAGSPFEKATAMLDVGDDLFITHSKHLAESLSTAQTAGPIKSGSAIFVQGTCSIEGKLSRFLAIIKADSDQALYKNVSGESITLTFVNDMLLGESQRLIKIAFFIEEVGHDSLTSLQRGAEDFSVKVFDHLMQSSGSGEAAAYFYSTFLKCTLSHNAARQTKRFFELSRTFISEMPVTSAEKVEYQGDLISYLRQSHGTLEPRSFAIAVLPELSQDLFIKTCRDSGINQAFSKDLELVKGKLRRQSVKFSSNVTLYAPAEVFREAVKILETSDDGWTDLKIKGLVEQLP
jgi:37-kD nucleoid-associated bacterial protein